MAATIIFPEKSVSHFNNNKNPRRSIRSSENLISADDLYSIRSFLSYNPNFSQQKPPLLPLPASSIPVYNSPPNQKFNKKKSNDLPSKKRNQSSFASNPKMFSGSSDQLGVLIVPPAKNRSRLPKANDVSENPSSLKIGEEEFPTSIFLISPHPSSLPLPKFSLRPKARLRCKADGFEGIDAGATDDLRRLLRLP